MKRFFKTYWWELLIIFCLSLTPLLWFKNGEILLGHDAGYRLDYHAQFSNNFYSWDPRINFGVDRALLKGFLITQAPEVIFSLLTRSFSIGQRCSMVFWFFIMGLGMWALLRRVFWQTKYQFLRLFSSIFFMYNFFILEGWSIAERGKFSLYAALPLGLLFLFDVFVYKKPRLLRAMLFGLLFFFLNGGGVLPLYGAVVVVLGSTAVFLTLYRVKIDGWYGLLFSLKTLCLFSVSVFLCNAYFIVPNIYLFLHNYGTSLGKQGGIDGLIVWERVISRYASFLNVIRLQGFPDWYDNVLHPFARTYLTNPVLILASFVPIVSILTGIIGFRLNGLKREQKMLIVFLLALLPIGLVLTMGTHLPLGFFYEQAMRRIPGFAMFRSSFYKFAPAFWLPVIILTGYFLCEALNRWIRKPNVRIALGVIVIILLLLYHAPYFTKDIFRFSDVYSTRLKLPSYVSETASYLNKHTTNSDRILLLPELDDRTIPDFSVDAYTWGYYSADVLVRNAIDRSFVANDDHWFSVRLLYDSLYKGDSQAFEKLSKALGITHVLWRGDVQETPLYSTKGVLEQFNTLQVGEILYESGPWKLYKLNNADEEVHIPQIIDTINAGSLYGAYLLTREENASQIIAKDHTPSFGKEIVRNEFIEAECFLCDPDEYNKLVKSITIPSPFQKFESIKRWWDKRKEEQAFKKANNSPSLLIDVYLSSAQRHLGYVLLGRQSQYESDYRKDILQSMEELDKLKGREQITYANRLYAYLEAHDREVKKVTTMNFDSSLSLFIQEQLKKIERVIWISNAPVWRWGITIPEDGSYQLVLPEGTKHALVDKIEVSLDDNISLTKGFHTLGIENNTQSRPFVFVKKSIGANVIMGPSISYKKIDPTFYTVSIQGASQPFFLVLKQLFVPGWQACIFPKAKKTNVAVFFEGLRCTDSVPENRHTEIDGFANGWYIDTSGDYEVYLLYRPQRVFYGGLMISSFFLLGIGVFMLYKIRTHIF